MRLLPTWAYMESYFTRLEHRYKMEIRACRTSILFRTAQPIWKPFIPLSKNKSRIWLPNSGPRNLILQTLFLLYDDLENRNRRNKNWVRGVPEATRDLDLLPTIKAIFATLWAHLGPRT